MYPPKPEAAEAKAWGWTVPLFKHYDGAGRVALRVVRAGIKLGGFSSIHLHRYQSNTLHVVSGKLIVLQFHNGDDLELWPHSVLWAGDAVAIPANRRHKFLAVEDCEIYESYLSMPGLESDPDDIIRFTENGCDPEQVLPHL